MKMKKFHVVYFCLLLSMVFISCGKGSKGDTITGNGNIGAESNTISNNVDLSEFVYQHEFKGDFKVNNIKIGEFVEFDGSVISVRKAIYADHDSEAADGGSIANVNITQSDVELTINIRLGPDNAVFEIYDNEPVVVGKWAYIFEGETIIGIICYGFSFNNIFLGQEPFNRLRETSDIKYFTDVEVFNISTTYDAYLGKPPLML